MRHCPHFFNVDVDKVSLTSVLIGELDAALDGAVDLSTIRAEPIPPIRY